MNNNLLHTLAIIFAAGIVLVGIIAALETGSSSDVRTISTSGEAMRTVAPDEVIISFSIVTEHEDANTARAENAARASQVVEALRTHGTVETANFYINPVYESYRFDGSERDPRIQLYRVTNTVTLTSSDLASAGQAIDAGTAAGANQVQNVQFALTDATQATIRTELLAEASENARAKAESLASGLDVDIKRVSSVSEGNVYFPGPFYARTAMDGAMAESAPTPIEPQDLDVSASVTVNFEIR